MKYIELLKKYNALENKYTTLEEYVKNKTFLALISKLGEPLEVDRLRKENKHLRLKIKELKALLK